MILKVRTVFKNIVLKPLSLVCETFQKCCIGIPKKNGYSYRRSLNIYTDTEFHIKCPQADCRQVKCPHKHQNSDQNKILSFL